MFRSAPGGFPFPFEWLLDLDLEARSRESLVFGALGTLEGSGKAAATVCSWSWRPWTFSFSRRCCIITSVASALVKERSFLVSVLMMRVEGQVAVLEGKFVFLPLPKRPLAPEDRLSKSKGTSRNL